MSEALIAVQRLNGGLPILGPRGNGWESGVTFNSAVTHLPRGTENDPLLRCLLKDESGIEPNLDADPELADGAVVLHYRARPRVDPGFRWTRSSIGLAVFTPALKLLRRFSEPVVRPGAEEGVPDQFGAEDPRITRVHGEFWMTYCGVSAGKTSDTHTCNVCMAKSTDLIHWDKIGIARGDIAKGPNKNGVLFPEPVNGEHMLMHRPMSGPQSSFSIHLASAPSPDGAWRERGEVLRAQQDDRFTDSWVGPGAVPISLGDRRFLVIYHIGHWTLPGEHRRYDLGAAIFNLQHPRLDQPDTVVEARLEPIMVPETDFEVNGPYPESVANVLFTCGAYEYRDNLHIIYGGGDSFILAAKVSTQKLLRRLETAGREAKTLVQ